MRGNPGYNRRAGYKPPPVNEAIGDMRSIPAPYGGWNATGNLSNMPATDAVLMDNIFPDISDVGLRLGRADWATGFASPVKRLMAYESSTSAKQFASTTTGVYDVTAAGAIGAAAFACTSGEWSSVNFQNSGGSFLTMVNGSDSMRLYDGATWTAITGASTPAITGVTTSTLAYVALHKRRLWFAQNNSMNLWYLAVDAIAGAATVFPVGALFAKGGKVVAIQSWTIDGGNGPDDYFAILTSKGEMAVYSGTDPANATTWSLVGVYYVGAPVGNRPFAKLGGDLLILTRTGIFPASTFMQSTVVDRTKAVNLKIQGAFLDYIDTYGANLGWEMTVYPPANALIVNVPTAVGVYSIQLVMNLTTKAWCRFTNWDASAFVIANEKLFYAGTSKTYQAWTGNSDSGIAITGETIQAYNSFRFPTQSQVGMVRPHLSLTGSATVLYSIDTDFRMIGDPTLISYAGANGIGFWDSGVWDTSLWGGENQILKPTWFSVTSELGYLHAFRLKIISSNSRVNWTATNFLVSQAGIL